MVDYRHGVRVVEINDGTRRINRHRRHGVYRGREG